MNGDDWYGWEELDEEITHRNDYGDLFDIASRTLQMRSELLQSRRELKRLQNIEKDYNKLLNDAVAHSNKMMGNTISLLLNKPLMSAIHSVQISENSSE